MKRFSLTTSIVLVTATLSSAQAHKGFPSLPSKVLSTYTPKKVEAYTPKVMAEKAQAFLASLDDKLRAQAALAYDSPEKAKWTNVPPRGPQGGVRIGDLDEKQMQLACDLLAAVLSPQGYAKNSQIPLADDRLLRGGKPRPGFGAENYWLAIFGKPSATGKWALQFDGHHLALNLAFAGDSISMSPTFVGTQPRAFDLAGKKIVPMADEAPLALALFESLKDDQKMQAIQGPKRANLVAAAGKDGIVPKTIGVSCKTFNEKQRKAVESLMARYVGDLPKPFADRRMKELAGQIDEMTFAWWGPPVEGGDFSYRLQGPSVLIEFAGQDLGGDPSNHLHSMYRDPTNEYGARLK